MTSLFSRAPACAPLRMMMFALVLGLRTSVSAMTYTVNSTVDEPNTTLGSPVCVSTPSAVCTLRAAVMAANANPGPDIISIPTGTFHLTIAGNDNVAQVGDLDITEDLTINGNVAGLTIIDGSLLSPGDRIFDVRPSTTVTMTGLTIRYGNATDNGGAIRVGDPSVVVGGATLNISNCSIQNNQTAQTGSGGGFFNATGSSLTITNCSISGGGGAFGGAIENKGSLTITDSDIANNNVNTAGGGIENDGGSASITGCTLSANGSFNGGAIENVAGEITIVGGTISNNNGGQGAGILNDATLVISNTTITGNTSNSSGGGIMNQPGGSLMLSGVTLSSNTANFYGGGIINQGSLTMTGGLLNVNGVSLDGGGGLAILDGTAVLTDIAISGNTGPFGGGVFVVGGTVTLINSTVSGNTTSDVGAGIYNHGATSTVNLANVTVAYNTTGFLKGGGGIDNDAGGTFNFMNTLVAWNSYQGIDFPVPINDCAGSLTSGGYNLVRVDCGFTHQTGDQVGTFSVPLDPLIGPLADNGGSTLTHALQAGSPAIDAGNPGGCRDPLGVLLTTDQRGYPRPAFGGTALRCDIGAYEFNAAPSATVTPTETPTATPTPTAGLCRLDVDGIGQPRADVATDIAYIARVLLGLVSVPASFRALDPRIPSDATIAANVAALGTALDVDGNGRVDVATDIVYIARRLLGQPPVPASFRSHDPSIASDATVAANVDALCP